MIEKNEEINLLIAGDKTKIYNEAISSLEKHFGQYMNIKITYTKNEYFQIYSNLIDEDGNYFNIIALNYKTKIEILTFFEDFNKNYKDTCLTSAAYPFFLVDKSIFKKIDLYNEIKKINSKRPELYRYNSKDIIEYDVESLPKKILGIRNYYYQIQEERIHQKTLNIMVCGKRKTGKTYLINELLFENRGLSKENNETTKITSYEHKLFPITFYDFPGFSDNEDRGMIDAANYISKFNEEYKNMKNKIHIIFYILQNDNGRVLQDKEIELIQNFLKTNVPIYFITNRIQKNNYKTFIRNVEERMKLIKSKYNLKELLSRLFILDESNKSIKYLLNAVIKELNISKLANQTIIKEFSQNFNENSSFVIINNNLEDQNEEFKRNKILEQMKKSIFFNDYSKTFKNIEDKINEIVEKIQKESNTHLIPLLSAKKDLIQLFTELKSEFQQFLSEDKMKDNFPALAEISEIDLDDNSIGIIIDAIICFISVLAIGSTGTFSLALGLPIYLYTGGKKKKKIEQLLRANANMMFNKFKDVSIEDNTIQRTAEEYNNIIDKFIQFSFCFDSEHENDIDLMKYKK